MPMPDPWPCMRLGTPSTPSNNGGLLLCVCRAPLAGLAAVPSAARSLAPPNRALPACQGARAPAIGYNHDAICTRQPAVVPEQGWRQWRRQCAVPERPESFLLFSLCAALTAGSTLIGVPRLLELGRLQQHGSSRRTVRPAAAAAGGQQAAAAAAAVPEQQRQGLAGALVGSVRDQFAKLDGLWDRCARA